MHRSTLPILTMTRFIKDSVANFGPECPANPHESLEAVRYCNPASGTTD